MKTTLLSLTMLAGIYNLPAQITINSNNAPSIGDQIEVATDTIANGITIGSNGATSWDFSSLSEHELVTTKFASPTGLPGSSDFPSSNLTIIDENMMDSSYSFLTKTSLKLVTNGLHFIDGGFVITLPTEQTIITFPSTYLTDYTDTSPSYISYFSDPGGVDPDGNGPHGRVDSIKVITSSNISSNMDAWGDVTTPFGTFPSLRQNVIEVKIDSAWQFVNGAWEVLSSISAAAFSVDVLAYDTTRTASWWTNDLSAKFPIAQIEYDANGSAISVDWQKSATTVGVDELTENAFEVSLYPNPANNQITIDISANHNSSVDILDVTGKLVRSLPFNTTTVKISVTDFNNGIYFYNIKDVEGNLIYSNKFIVAK